MQKIKKILLVILFVIFQPFVANIFAQQTPPPSDFGTTGETAINPNDSQAPIDTYLVLLLLTGCFFSFYKFQIINKKGNSRNTNR
jgi:hypothetical protein